MRRGWSGGGGGSASPPEPRLRPEPPIGWIDSIGEGIKHKAREPCSSLTSSTRLWRMANTAEPRAGPPSPFAATTAPGLVQWRVDPRDGLQPRCRPRLRRPVLHVHDGCCDKDLHSDLSQCTTTSRRAREVHGAVLVGVAPVFPGEVADVMGSHYRAPVGDWCCGSPCPH